MRAARAEYAASPRPVGQSPIVLAGSGVLALGSLWLGAGNWRLGALFLIGALLGVSLYHAAFGFTAAYRNAIVRRDVSGAIAQLVMLGVAMLLFAPVLAQGEAFGRGVVGAVAPASVQVAVGSFLFGLGMQLGGGCGSGTLYTAGGGNTRMLVTLAAFCAGAFLGSLDMARWADLPSLGPSPSHANSAGRGQSPCSSASWRRCGWRSGTMRPTRRSSRSGIGSPGARCSQGHGHCCSPPRCWRCSTLRR